MPNLLVLVPFCDEHVAALRRAAGPGWTVERRGPADASTPTAICSGRYDLPDDELVRALVRADVVIGEPAPALLRRAADAGSRLRLVQMTWAGTDKYTRSDVPFPAGARLCCAVGGFGQLISQYVVAQVLGLMQNLPAYRDEQRLHRWGDLGPVGSLDGARVLVFGAGNIGGWVARRLSGFDCTVTGVAVGSATVTCTYGSYTSTCTVTVQSDESESVLNVYDVKEGSSAYATVSGDGFIAGQGATYTVTGSQTDVGKGVAQRVPIQADAIKIKILAEQLYPVYIRQTQTVIRDRDIGSVFICDRLHGSDTVEDLFCIFAVKRQQSAGTPVVKIVQVIQPGVEIVFRFQIKIIRHER